MALRDEVLELLRRDPAFREELRRQLLTEELLSLPALFRELAAQVHQLAEAQRRTEASLAQLTERVDRLTERMDQLTERMDRLTERMDQLTERVDRLTAQVDRLTEQVDRLTERMDQLTERVDQLTERVDQLTERVDRLTERVDQLTERVDRLTAQVDRLTERVDRLTERMDRLTERVDRLTEQMQELVSWQRGEAGRRDGERFEREVSLRALRLFSGGRGGAPSEAWVRERLAEQLQAGMADDVSAEEDPLLADLVWWKGDQVAVVEISLQVNGGDLTRAAARAATLARAGVRALPVVIGEAWARPETVRQAEALGIAWKVGPDPSAGFLAFRRAA